MGEGEEEVDESSFVPNLFICHTVSKLTKLPGKEFFFVFWRKPSSGRNQTGKIKVEQVPRLTAVKQCFFEIFFDLFCQVFLDASTHLYMRVCPSVHRSVCPPVAPIFLIVEMDSKQHRKS